MATNQTLRLPHLLVLFLAVILVMSGCKNRAPLITHNWPTDSIIVDHGNAVDLDIRYLDDRDELMSSSLSFNNEMSYSGSDTSFLLQINTSDLDAGKYIAIASASDQDENESKKRIAIVINPVKPILGELDVNGVRATGTRVNFSILSYGGIPLTEKGVVFSEDGEPGAGSDKIIIPDGQKEIDAYVEGLPRNSDIYLRAYAVNKQGTTYSNSVKIKTMTGIPVISTGSVNDIHAIRASGSGILKTDGGENLRDFGICYSVKENPTVKDMKASTRTGGKFITTLTGLNQFTTYYYRSYAINRFATVYGEIKKFETTGPPAVITGDYGRIMVSSIEMKIDVTENGGHEVTEAGIAYSMFKNPTIDNNTFVLGKGTGSKEGKVVNLEPGTQYHIRAYAVNSDGVGYGDEIVLFTKIGIPEVHTMGITDIDYSSVTVVGDIPDDGGLDIVERGVVWDTVQRPTKKNNFATVPGTDGKFNFTINSLESGVKYYARAYAANERGYVYGEPLEFIPYLKTDMAIVEAGTFMMGSDEGDTHEQPVHEVKLSSFSIGKYEVTNGEFAKFLNYLIDKVTITGNDEIVNIDNHPVYFLKVFGDEYDKAGFHPHIRYTDGQFVVDNECDKYPAVLVTWYGAEMFCEWAGGRLPTEAEWEFSAKSGGNSTARFAGGDDLDRLGWYYKNSKGAMCKLTPDGRGLNPTGIKKSNSLGLFDMTGNASEWCFDIYKENYYADSPTQDPMGAEKGIYRVIRGGSWADRESECTVYRRIKSFDIDRGYDNISFRLVRPLSKTTN